MNLYPAFRIDSEGQRVAFRRDGKSDKVMHRHGHKEADHLVHVIRRTREEHDNFYGYCGAKGIAVLEFLPLEEITCEACLALMKGA